MKKINYRKNSKGQAIVEYIIVTSLIGIICLSLVKQFGTTLKTRLNYINTTLVNKIKV